MIISRRMRWAGHVAGMGGDETQLWLESLKWKDHSENLDVYGRTILNCVSGKWGWRLWIRNTWLRIGTGGGLLWTR
jgi:hypothetical protein